MKRKVSLGVSPMHFAQTAPPAGYPFTVSCKAVALLTLLAVYFPAPAASFGIPLIVPFVLSPRQVAMIIILSSRKNRDN